MVDHIRTHADIARQLGLDGVRIEVSDLSGSRSHPLDRIIEALGRDHDIVA